MLSVNGTNFTIYLEPDAPIFETTCIISRNCFERACRNEDGIMSDNDIEHLHVYRVSIRKLRSLLSLFRGVLSGTASRQLRDELSGIMGVTNRLRDLDVFLQARQNFYDLLTESHHPGLDTVFELITEERHSAFGKVVTFMSSPDYQMRMNDLRLFFSDPGSHSQGPSASEPSFQYICRCILGQYHEIADARLNTDPGMIDSDMHRLRIQCKKLRYVMELFISFFPTKTIRSLIRPLKEVQDFSGEYNDIAVQQKLLAALIESNLFSVTGSQYKQKSAEILIEKIFEQKYRVLDRFEICLGNLTNEEIRNRFENIFSGRKQK